MSEPYDGWTDPGWRELANERLAEVPETPLRHVWRLDEDGVRDDFAADPAAIHMGPACTVCGESFCMNCEDLDSLVCEGPTPRADLIEYAQKEIIRLQAFLAKAEHEGRLARVSETPIPPEGSQP